MFDLQEKGTLQLTYDVTSETPTISSVASRDVFLNGCYSFKLKGALFSATNSITTSYAPTVLQITSPQIRSSLTPNSPGIVIHVENELDVVQQSSFPSPTVGLTCTFQADIGNPLEHTLVAEIQNKLDISIGVANGYNAAQKGILYNTDFSTHYNTPAGKAYLSLTFEYHRLY
jgi:hypothetical protein